MKKPKWQLLLFGPAALAAVFAIRAANVTAQDAVTPDSAMVALANIEQQHTHSIVLRAQDVADLIANLRDGESVNLQSSAGYDSGAANGILHTHNVPLSKADLTTLHNAGTVTVESDFNFGHQHAFKFILQQECPAVASPLPTTSPSVSPTPSVTPSPSPSESPSPSPSPSPSASPSPTFTILAR